MRSISTFFLLLCLTNHLSECLTVPNGQVHQPKQALLVPPRNSHHVNRGGHPALLDAIVNFEPSSSLLPRHHHPSDARRIFHGRGGLFPGADHLTLDYYPPAFLLTSFQPLAEEELNVYGNALEELWERNGKEELLLLNGDAYDVRYPIDKAKGASCDNHNDPKSEYSNEVSATTQSTLTWVYQCRARGNTTTQLMSGTIPQPHIVTENNGQNQFLVHLSRGQNHGLFLDMASGRSWLQTKCSTGEVSTVLNLFAYTCAFSIAALNGGAETVVNVDMSHGALKIGQRNHELNPLVQAKGKGKAKFLAHDLFKTWGKLKKLGPYDCVVCDPPSYQKGSFVAKKDYGKVLRRLPSLLAPNGWALLCLNAPELDTDFLLEKVKEEVGEELHFVERLANPSTFASAFPERALKVMVFQYRPLTME